MPDSLSLFRETLRRETQTHGRAAEICRLAKVNRSTFDYWVKGITVPQLDQVDRIATALGRPAWELIKPPSMDHTEQLIEKIRALSENDRKLVEELVRRLGQK